MQRLYKKILRIYLLILAAAGAVYWAGCRYEIFIENSPSEHTLINDGTLAIFEKTEPEKLKEHDIVTIKNTSHKTVRILSINKKENTAEAVYDDFNIDKTDISINNIDGVLKFYIDDVGNIYNDYLAEYKNIFLSIPFFCIALSFMAYLFHKNTLLKEDTEFDFHNLIKRYHNYLNYHRSYTIKKDNMEIIETLSYDNFFKNGKIPLFTLKNPVSLTKNEYKNASSL